MIDTDTRLTILFCVATGLLTLVVWELTRETKRVEVAVVKADLSAAEISALLEEANTILKRAAAEGPDAVE
jgi:hypothetical protein